MHLWISRHLPDVPKPNLVRPVNYSRVIGMLIGALAVTSIVTVSSKYILPLLRSRNLWTALSLLAILLFTTGHMFNHIRKVPYVAGDGKGGISYFAGGFQTQFGLESQIIAAICESPFLTPSPLAQVLAYLLTSCPRRRFVPWVNCTCYESTPDLGPSVPASHYHSLECRDLGHVQLPHQRLPREECFIPSIDSSILIACHVDYVMNWVHPW